MEEKAYKILHKFSGLFYQTHTASTSNLSKKGKTYSSKPSLRHIRGLRVTKKQNDEIFGGAGCMERYSRYYYVDCNINDFEVVEVGGNKTMREDMAAWLRKYAADFADVTLDDCPHYDAEGLADAFLKAFPEQDN